MKVKFKSERNMTSVRLLLGFVMMSWISVTIAQEEKSGHGGKTYPNIIFIMADDLGWNDVSYNDPNHQIPTPNIDALGLNGVIINRHYSTHMCTPSRASLMTGAYPIHTGMQHWVIDVDEPWALPLERKIMPQFFKDVGYETYMIGKWHLGFHKTEYTPLARGYDHHYGYWGPYIDYWTKTMVKLDRPYHRGLDFRNNTNMIRDTNTTYATYMFTDAAVDYIEAHDKKRPMFMVINHLAPHTANEDDPMQAPESEVNKHSCINDTKRRKMAAMTNIMDQGIGKVVTALKRKRMLENSVIVFISDNGAPTIGLHSNLGSNYPLRGQKNSPWEGGVRTPAVIYSPLIQIPRRISNDLFHITDWLPTLMSAAGIRLDKSMKEKLDGVDQWNMLSFGLPGKRREALLNINPVVGWSGLIKDDWKLVNKSEEPKTDGWLSNASIGTSYPDDISYVKSVVNSEVAVAIGKRLKAFEVIETLNKNKIRCGPPPTKESNPYHCDLSKKSACLFNIRRDPCEFYDVSEKYPFQLKQMQTAIWEYTRNMMPSLYKPTDPNCNPLYYNDTWVSWNDDRYRKGNECVVSTGAQIPAPIEKNHLVTVTEKIPSAVFLLKTLKNNKLSIVR